jgi:prepilin-type processing-associated H-X9-DG protein
MPQRWPAIIRAGDELHAVLTEIPDDLVRSPAASQLVHGDLTGNVLFADGLAPGIIDFSPYLRPTAYAVGVVVADAVVWEGADLELLAAVADRPEMGQCLVRALIFRHVTALLLPGRLPAGDAASRYARLRDAAITLAAP